MKCFRCDKELENVLNFHNVIQPKDGLAFVTYGHYGSTFFDPMDGTKLEIVICDECLKNNSQNFAKSA